MKYYLLLVFSIFSFVLSADVLLEKQEEQFLPIQSKKSWNFPAVPGNGQVVVEFEHRIHYPKLGGWAPILKIKVNGEYIKVKTLDNQQRILNKNELLKHKVHKQFKASEQSSFYSIYSPDYSQGKNLFLESASEAYRLVLDVTDLVNSQKNNQLEFVIEGSFLKDYYTKKQIAFKPGIMIRNLKVSYNKTTGKIKKAVMAQQIQFKGKNLVNSPEEITIAVAKFHRWEFDAVSSGKRISVEFEFRIEHPRGGGWNPCTQFAVNGKLISALYDRNHTRLLNKPFRMKHKTYKHFDACDGFKWNSLFSPDYEFSKKYFDPESPEAYRVVLDITDLLFSNKKNQFEIRFGGSWMVSYYKNNKINAIPALKVRNFKIIQGNDPSSLPRKNDKEFVSVAKKKRILFSVSTDQGGLIIRQEKEPVVIYSSFSVPGKTAVVSLGRNDKTENDFYKVTRKIVSHKNRIDILDTFSNKTAKLIGIRIQYDTKAVPFDQIYIGGDNSPETVLRKSGQNPTVFLGNSQLNFGVGIVAVDDVFRVQNQQFIKDGRVGIKTENFALSPGETRKVEWSVYPVASADYFDFINEVRWDWNVNFTIDGGFAFTILPRYKWKENELRHYSDQYGLSYNSTGCFSWRWNGGEYANYVDTLYGNALFDDFHRGRLHPGAEPGAIASKPMRNMLKNAANKAKKELKGSRAKTLCYVHNQLSVEIDDWKKYPDSIITHADGSPWVYGTNKISMFHIFLPTPDNKFGKKTMQYLKNVIDVLGFDGIYNDEFNHCGPRVTYAQWDKVSVELDEQNNVKRKIGFVPLLILPFNIQVMDEFVVKRKVPFVANFSPETRTELRYHFPRFEETFHNYMPLSAHLFTPIQLGDMLVYPKTPNGLMEDIRNALYNGLLYYFYTNRTVSPAVTKYMFPFTPIELHRGWLLGKERILTIYSGEYGWYAENSLCIPYVSDECGMDVKNPKATFLSTQNGTRCRLILNKNHCAVLVKIPVNAKFSGTAVMEKISYTNKQFHAILKGKGTVEISKDGKKYRFEVKDKELSVTL